MIGELHVITVDCPAPAELAAFYRELLGLTPTVDTGQYVVLANTQGTPVLALQQVSDYHPPHWPDPARPSQLHLDVLVPDLDEAEPRVLALGATLLDGSDKPIGYRVYADPVGHPFCLVTPESL